MSKRLSTVFLAVALWLLAIFLLVKMAHADTLQAVQAPTDWTGWLIALGLILLVAAGVYAHRRWPSQSAKVDAEVKADLAKAIGDLRVLLATKLADKGQTVDASGGEPTVEPPGKKGQAGPLTVMVGGTDFQADLAAFMSAYGA